MCYSISQLDPNDLAAKGATLLHHLAVWMIEENKNKEASSVNNSMSVPNPESLPSTSGHNTSQGPLYENLAKTSGPVYQNLEEVKNDKGDNQSFRAEVMYDKDVSTSSIGLLSNVSLKGIIYF